MTAHKIVTLYSSPKEGDRKVPLHVRIARVEDNLAQKVLQDASELFLEEVLNLTVLERVARYVTGAQYVHVIVVEHPSLTYGVCARISFGAGAADPNPSCFWVPVDTRFLTS